MAAGTDFSLIIGFGTDMGSAEDAAMGFAEAVEEAVGVEARAIELNQIEPADLLSASHFIAVTSTFGGGEFPDSATVFWEAISADGIARLEKLKFSVLALGDSGYDLFCNAGRLLGERLAALGAMRLVDRVDVDGAYEQPAAAWTADVVKLLAADHAGPVPSAAVRANTHRVPADDANQDRSRPVEVRLVVNRLFNARESDKEVRHYEVDLAGSGLTYQAGDSIAVHATNDPTLVEAILTEFGLSADHPVADHVAPLGELLAHHFEIRTPSRELRVLVASRTPDAEVADALGDDGGASPGSWLYGKGVLDLIRAGDLTVDELLDCLRPLQPRDYSIASSPTAHPDRAHLTVTTVRYTAGDGRRHGGVASTYLADRGDSLLVRLRPNHYFRLPAGDVPIIVIGPGTGIAPFRGFLQERAAVGAPGPSWLFFGDRRRSTDFLYGDELESFVASGTLTRLDMAFSRDAGDKCYVEHRMWENAPAIFDWLEDGAHVYVCGDALSMAKDVDAMLHKIVARCGAWTRSRRTPTSTTSSSRTATCATSTNGLTSRLSFRV